MGRSRRASIIGRILACTALLWSCAATLATDVAPLAASGAKHTEPAPITVYGAASLGKVLDELAVLYYKSRGQRVVCSYASSAVLARQIEAGATADLFLSADTQWMDYLQQRVLIKPGSRSDLLGNTLVLIAPADSQVHLTIAPGFALAAALSGGRLAMGDPDSVPAGRYARQSLTALGVWSAVQAQVAGADSVRTALAFVARGETPLGIVYGTDVLDDARVRLIGVFPADSHDAIVYPVALTTSASAAAQDFLGYLKSSEAAAVFRRHAFAVLAPANPSGTH